MSARSVSGRGSRTATCGFGTKTRFAGSCRLPGAKSPIRPTENECSPDALARNVIAPAYLAAPGAPGTHFDCGQTERRVGGVGYLRYATICGLRYNSCAAAGRPRGSTGRVPQLRTIVPGPGRPARRLARNLSATRGTESGGGLAVRDAREPEARQTALAVVYPPRPGRFERRAGTDARRAPFVKRRGGACA